MTPAAATNTTTTTPPRVRRFLLTLVGLLAITWAIYYYPYSATHPIARSTRVYLQAYTHATVGILRLFGEDARAVGQSVVGPASVRIDRGCDAIQAKALFACALLAFPASWRKKVIGLVLGLGALILLNLLRIVTLYYIHKLWPTWFDFWHFGVWQFAYIGATVAIWLAWATQGVKPRRKQDA